ncbi:MAG: magnesium transporter [Gemmatimonadales bacterium]|jgi:magnesium transporter
MARVSHLSRALSRRFSELYPNEFVTLLEALPAEEVAAHLEQASTVDAAAILDRLRPDVAADVIDLLAPDVLCTIAPLLDPGRTAGVLARLDDSRRSRLIDGLDYATARELSTLMEYPADSAGGIMDPRVTTFRPDAVVRDTIKRLRRLGRKRISDVFLIDDSGLLVGAVALQDLVTAEPGDRLARLAKQHAVSIQATAPRDDVIELFESSKAASVPVVDFHGHILGVIRFDALVAAVQTEASADVQTMVGASKDERALSGIAFAVRRRLPWLQVNLGTAFLAAAVVGLFEGTIARFTALAVLLPVVAGQSGNTGAQALAVTMRGLALREIRTRHWWRVALKEVGTGAINGVAVAFVTGAAVYVWSGSPGLSAVIVTAMVVSMTIAGFAGASVPIVLEKLGQDPAQASSIILTTVTDVMGFLSFLGLATLAAGLL